MTKARGSCVDVEVGQLIGDGLGVRPLKAASVPVCGCPARWDFLTSKGCLEIGIRMIEGKTLYAMGNQRKLCHVCPIKC